MLEVDLHAYIANIQQVEGIYNDFPDWHFNAVLREPPTSASSDTRWNALQHENSTSDISKRFPNPITTLDLQGVPTYVPGAPGNLGTLLQNQGATFEQRMTSCPPNTPINSCETFAWEGEKPGNVMVYIVDSGANADSNVRIGLSKNVGYRADNC